MLIDDDGGVRVPCDKCKRVDCICPPPPIEPPPGGDEVG